jgi:hypothetical protein
LLLITALLFTGNLFDKHGQIEMEIYRKPKTTDIIINNNSCHPKQQKLAAHKNWIHRLLTLPLEENAKELNTIINIALNNDYRKEDIIRSTIEHCRSRCKGREDPPLIYSYKTSHNYITNLNKRKVIRIVKPKKNKNGSHLPIREISHGKS